MSVRRTAAAATGIAALVLSLTACGGAEVTTNTPDDLVIGVSGTDPGLAVVNSDGSFSGFDVDLASYLAKGLGWNDRDVTFEMVAPEQREVALANGDIDMVVSAYPMTSERDKAVDFAGPYFVAGQDLLVALDSRVTGPTSLAGARVCGAAGSGALRHLKEPEYSPGAALQEADDTSACVDRLLKGQVDAVTGDDVALAGYAQQHPEDLKVVGSPFSTEYYGVGLPPGSPDVGVVNDLLARAMDDGTWQSDFDRHFGSSGYTPPVPPPPGTTVF